MILHLDTTNADKVNLVLTDRNEKLVQHSFAVHYDQAEKLLPELDKFLVDQGYGLADLKKTVVANGQGTPASQAKRGGQDTPASQAKRGGQGAPASQAKRGGQGSFTSLRLGLATANALAYALNIPVEDQDGQVLKVSGLQIVEPRYDREPKISLPKNT